MTDKPMNKEVRLGDEDKSRRRDDHVTDAATADQARDRADEAQQRGTSQNG